MKRYVAELVGTLVLVFGGCGSVMLAGDKIDFAGVSFAFGFSLLAMVYAIGPISSCHLNPAVTVGLLLARKVQARFAAGYLVAQVVGAMLATGVLSLIAKGGPPLWSRRRRLCGQRLRRALPRALPSHGGFSGGGHPLSHRETALPAEHLFQEIGRPGCGIRPDLLLLLPQHIEQPIEAFAHDVTIEVEGWLLRNGMACARPISS